MSDIIDDIDALVDSQLRQEPSGYDHNVNQDTCWHCGRHWHGLPLTARVAGMYELGVYDETYDPSSDTTPVVCQGSTFIGPMPTRIKPHTVYEPNDYAALLFQHRFQHEFRWWRCILPGDAVVDIYPHEHEVRITVGIVSTVFSAQNVRIDRGMANGAVMDVLSIVAPSIGGTWEPLTAPGVTQHPSEGGSEHA